MRILKLLIAIPAMPFLMGYALYLSFRRDTGNLPKRQRRKRLKNKYLPV
jgi:hypothetical protein